MLYAVTALLIMALCKMCKCKSQNLSAYPYLLFVYIGFTLKHYGTFGKSNVSAHKYDKRISASGEFVSAPQRKAIASGVLAMKAKDLIVFGKNLLHYRGNMNGYLLLQLWKNFFQGNSRTNFLLLRLHAWDQLIMHCYTMNNIRMPMVRKSFFY